MKKVEKILKQTDSKILNQTLTQNVWRKFLESDEFYLVMSVNPKCNIEYLMQILKMPRKGFKILDVEGIKNLPCDEIGFIVNIDWEHTDKLYMPDELFHTKIIETDPLIQAVYSINNGEGILNSSYERAKILSQVLDIPLLSFDKHEYDPTYEIHEEVYNEMVGNIITHYLMKNNLDLSLRDQLVERYQNDIITAFRLVKKENAFNDEIFMSKALDYIKEKENIKLEF